MAAPHLSPPEIRLPELLSSDHDLTGFTCGEPALDDWLRHRAPRSENPVLRTYVVCTGLRVVAFVSIATGAVNRAGTAVQPGHNAPESLPVAIIPRLAVDSRHTGRGLAADLLSDTLRRIARDARSTGITGVLAHAETDAARDFYRHCAEFLDLPTARGILFLPMGTLTAAIH